MTGSGETVFDGAEGECEISQAKGPGHDDTLQSTHCVHRRSNLSQEGESLRSIYGGTESSGVRVLWLFYFLGGLL